MSISKKITIICFSLVLLLIVIYGIGKILTTNISKQFIIQKLEATTGYQVSIEGDLDWHYTLRPNVEIKKIIFHAQNKTVIQFEHANIGIALLPLLQKRFSISFHFKTWQQNQLHFENGAAHLTYENNLLTLSDFNADFYQGQISGHALINLNNDTPTFQMSLKTTQTQIASLLKDIANTASVSGKMELQANLKSAGSDANQFIQNLNGNINITVKEGKLNTIHFGNVISYVTSNIDKQQADFFNTLSIHDVVVNGVGNSQIDLLAKSYMATGKGSINFNTQALNIHLNAYYIQSQKTKNIAIPVTITGLIASPNVSVDLSKPLGALLKNNEEKIKNKLDTFLQRL